MSDTEAELLPTPDAAPVSSAADWQGQLEALLTEGQLAEALGRLQALAAEPDQGRSASANLWLYRTLAQVLQAHARTEEAVDAYGRAFGWEPRDLLAAQCYSELLLELGRCQEAVEVIQILLLHHKRELSVGELTAVHRRMGALYDATGDLERARIAWDKAVEYSPEDALALAGLLELAARTGDAEQVFELRRRLIRKLPTPQDRATALVALAEEMRLRGLEASRVLELFQGAANEDPGCVAALGPIAELCRELGDNPGLYQAYIQLSRAGTDAAQAADWLIKASIVARDELWESDRALTGLRQALALDPERLDAFEAITALLYAAADWEGLEASYVELIALKVKQEPMDRALVAVLWQKLGELYRLRLNRRPEAMLALEEAASLLEGNFAMHDAVAEMAEADPEEFARALRHLGIMRELAPGNLSVVDRIGRLFLRRKDVDRAYCHFRTLQYLGHEGEEKVRAFCERLESPLFRTPRAPLGWQLIREHLFDDALDPAISEVFSIIKLSLDDWDARSRSDFGLKRRDRVDVREELAFNNLYRRIGESLGYEELPELWRKSDQVGLINGALNPEGLIVGDDLLASGLEKHIAFVVAKQLFLFMSPFYLAAVRPLGDLQGYFLRAAALVRPELGLERVTGNDDAFKQMKKRLKGAQFERLQRKLQESTRGGTEVDIGLWLEAVEDTANRVGFVFCDDLRVVEAYLTNDPQPIGGRSVAQRMQSLVDYSISEKYLSLREALGIRVA